MAKFDSILGTIGHTPVVKINKLAPAGVNVYVKIEAFNPLGSVKDRLALGVIEAAEKSGQLKPGQTVIEATSGNTGIGLAMVCAALATCRGKIKRFASRPPRLRRLLFRRGSAPGSGRRRPGIYSRQPGALAEICRRPVQLVRIQRRRHRANPQVPGRPTGRQTRRSGPSRPSGLHRRPRRPKPLSPHGSPRQATRPPTPRALRLASSRLTIIPYEGHFRRVNLLGCFQRQQRWTDVTIST